MKIGNKKELKSIAEENSGHLDFKDVLKIYNYCTKEPYSFILIEIHKEHLSRKILVLI